MYIAQERLNHAKISEDKFEVAEMESRAITSPTFMSSFLRNVTVINNANLITLTLYTV